MFRVLEQYSANGGLQVGDIVSTGKRTKKVKAIKLVQVDNKQPELWFFLECKNGSESIVLESTAKKYKVIN